MRIRLAALALGLGALLAAPRLEAQYFGQNKVQYRYLDFKVIETEHFEVHYYQGMREAAIDAARMAERSYARLSRVLNQQYRERQPILLYASNTEFQQNNITDIDESTGGVTDPLRHRIMLPFTGANKDFEHVLTHEMVHQFQFDIFARGRIGAGLARLSMVAPPLWFMEGMAEYLSLGPIDAPTTMWLRDGSLEGTLPTIEQMTTDPRTFPYRYGHALLAYIGERWGDEVIGEILHGVANSGMDQGFRRALGITMEELSNDWQDAVRRNYLPQITDLQLPRQFSKAVLTEEKSTGQVHVSPAISPDGTQIAYLSEGSTFFIDLYLADAETGRVKGRLIKSAFNSNSESLRFINSAGSWSPDGRYFAIAVKHGGKDDLVIFDVKQRREHKRIKVNLNGLTNPAWSPDGKQIVFTGYDDGVTDLFIQNVDGSGPPERLSHDKFADLHPSWSPDGKTIALATDRGFPTDTMNLKYSAPRIGLYHLDTHQFEDLPGMVGSNVNPQWAPDGKSIAFVSDRDGTANLYLYDMTDRQTYQLTKVYTGIGTFSPLAPVISWARGADRLVFTYYEKGPFRFNTYAIDNPRSLKQAPYHVPPGGIPVASLMRNAPAKMATAPVTTQIRSARALADSITRDTAAALRALAAGDSVDAGGSSIYRDPSGFRASAETPAATLAGGEPVSVKALLDSATLALPDTAEFGFKKYSAKLVTDFIARPSVGYTRDNFGNGVYGGGGISFSDILGNRRVLLAAQVNGRIEEAVIQGIYANLGHRTYWLQGYEQYPVFFFSGSEFGVDSSNGRSIFSTRLERLLYHQAFFQTVHPFNRFRRIELGVRAAYVTRANQDYVQYFDPVSRLVYAARIDTKKTGETSYIQPTLGFTFDNSISEWVGPTMGRRSHFEYAPAIGGSPFHEVTADYRRYDQPLRPFTIATRAMFLGRFGGDTAFQYRYFLGFPEFLRGYTGGSFRRNECLSQRPEEILICDDLDQMIGSRIALVNAELRFPLARGFALGLLPIGFPPIEGAVFFDAGMAWNNGSTIVWPWDNERSPTANKREVRTVLKAWGFSVRANVAGILILRLDWTRPLDRPAYKKGYWTLNIGPTF